MKKLMISALLLSCIFACLPLTSCDVTPGTNGGDEPPYVLKYTSYGDGTCYVSEITTRPNVAEPYTVEIPETSPDGDRVVAVNPSAILHDTAARNIPSQILAEDFEAICNTAKQNGIPDFDYTRLTSCFVKLSTEGLSEQGKAELIETFPVTEFADIYVLDQKLDVRLTAMVSDYLCRYAAFDENDRYEMDRKLGQITEEHELGSALDLSYNYTAFMEKLVLPASVMLVNLPTSAFKEIFYAGTLAEWEAGSHDVNGLLGTRIVCSDGETTYREQYVIRHDGSIAFARDLAQNVTVKLPDTRHGQPYTDVTLHLGYMADSDRKLVLTEEYESLLSALEQQGMADKAEKYRESMAIVRTGSVEYVIVYDDSYFLSKLSLPEDYFVKATARVCEKTRVTEDITALSSKHFTALELPATLQTLEISLHSYRDIYLADVYYPGTLEQWSQVEVLSNTEISFMFPLITVHCTDGETWLTDHVQVR